MVTGLNDPDAAPDDGPPCSRANGCFHLRIVRFGALRRFRPNATIGERAGLWITAVDSGRDDVSRPVSRVLSAAQSAAGRPFLWDGSCETPRATNPDDWPGDRLTAPAHACGAIASSLFGFAPGGVCPAVAVTGDAVGSYPTVSPLPRQHCGSVAPHYRRGGLFSVALSLGFPPPDVIRHRFSVEPGLSSPAAFRHWSGAAAQPADAPRLRGTGP